ncbi:MAG: hypothetical protein RDU89_06895 [bacterium]|nr:hypothetical protein [bacterium]
MARPTDVQRVTRATARPRRPQGETPEQFDRRVRGVRMPSDFDPAVAAAGPVTTYRQRAVPVDAVSLPRYGRQREIRPPRVTIGTTRYITLTRAAGEHLGAPRVDLRYSASTRQLWIIAAGEDPGCPKVSSQSRSDRASPRITHSVLLRVLRDREGIAPGRYPAEPVLTADGRKALVVQFPEPERG